jgi:hypothetical protein
MLKLVYHNQWGALYQTNKPVSVMQCLKVTYSGHDLNRHGSSILKSVDDLRQSPGVIYNSNHDIWKAVQDAGQMNAETSTLFLLNRQLTNEEIKEFLE